MDKKSKWPTGIQPRGRGLRIRIWKHGKPYCDETITCDPYSKSDLAAAVKRREYLTSRVRLGLPLYDDEETTATLFTEAAQEYLNTLQADLSTHLSYENILNNIWIPEFGRHLLADITTRRVKTILASKAVTHKTKKNYLIPLRGVLHHYDVQPNPAQFKLPGKHQKKRVERFTPDEREIILNQLTGNYQIWYAILFGTGLRPSELLALTWQDYNGEQLNINKTIVRRKLKMSTKTHEERTVYVPAWVREHIGNLDTRFESSYLFLNSVGGPHLDTEHFNAAWREAFNSHTVKRKHKIHYRIPYTCRHSRAAELLSTGVEPGDAAKQLGHTLEMFYRTYSEWIEEYSGKRDLERFEGYSRPKHDPKKEREKHRKEKIQKIQSLRA